ncbi:ribosomal protein L7/L12 [Sphingomonas sp. ASY06-1R]|uniref:ribosomal protein L7/L12 n=1 Tax=Sphingomonas sp. ASY06-1R TaxID=3445771 RepID=UPI003FA1CFE3
MFVPVPILILFGLAFALMAVQLVRMSRRPDPLLGGPMAGRGYDAGLARAQTPAMPQPARPSDTLPSAALSPATLTPEVEAEARALLAAGRKINAIKVVRDATHMGLSESKDLVEQWEYTRTGA